MLRKTSTTKYFWCVCNLVFWIFLLRFLDLIFFYIAMVKVLFVLHLPAISKQFMFLSWFSNIPTSCEQHWIGPQQMWHHCHGIQRQAMSTIGQGIGTALNGSSRQYPHRLFQSVALGRFHEAFEHSWCFCHSNMLPGKWKFSFYFRNLSRGYDRNRRTFIRPM